MPLEPFELGMSPDETKNWLRTNLSSDFFSEGSADSQWSFLRELGVNVSRQDYRDIHRDMLGLQFHEREIRNLLDNDFIEPQYYYTRHELQLSATYLYRFEITLRDNRTGEEFTTKTAMLSDEEFSIGDLKSQKTMQIEYETENSDLTVMDISVIGALVRTQS